MISVITPTIREGSLGIVERALSRQTYRDFEWLIGAPFNPGIDSARWVEDRFTGGYWTLNRIYNELIRQARGDLLVSWQDNTYADPSALEKFAFHYEQEQETLVTGVGNKYSDDSFVAKVWQDPRERGDMGTYYPCVFDDIEWNFCSVPKVAVYAVGGFDEGMDFLGYGMDGYSVNDRLNTLGGWDFKIDQTNKSYSLVHGRVGGSEKWDKYNLVNGGYQKHRAELISEGVWPVLRYLLNEKEN